MAIDLERFEAGYRRTAELLSRGDVAEAYAWVPDSFVWHVLAETLPQDDTPEHQPVLHGRAEVIAFFERLNDEWAWRPDPQSFELEGDSVVVRVIGTLTGRATGLKGEVRFTQTWELGADGVPVRAYERLEDYYLDELRPS